MAQKTKIKEDFLGLYVIAGGYITRPFYGTIFKEGDVVKSHHFGGSTKAGVTHIDQNFKKDGKYEIWCTTGIHTDEYSNKKIKYGFENLFGVTYNTFEEYLKLTTSWYKSTDFRPFAEEHNQNFAIENLIKK